MPHWSPNGVSGMDIKEIISAYPNPFTDRIHFQSKTPVGRAVIYDMTGKKMKEISNSNAIETYGLAKGTYLLELHIDGNKSIHKIMRQ